MRLEARHPLMSGEGKKKGVRADPSAQAKVRGQHRVGFAHSFQAERQWGGSSVAHLSQNEPTEPGAAGSTTTPCILAKMHAWSSFSLIKQRLGSASQAAGGAQV